MTADGRTAGEMEHFRIKIHEKNTRWSRSHSPNGRNWNRQTRNNYVYRVIYSVTTNGKQIVTELRAEKPKVIVTACIILYL